MDLPRLAPLAPVFLQKVWAAPGLAGPLGPALAAPPATGEVWLASDRHAVTPVAAGPWEGLGLDEVVRRWPEYVTGQARPAGFPLLVKILAVGQWLSVQVHPDDQAARRLEGEPWGKSEAWHVLAAGPAAQIIHGLAPGVGRAEVAQAAAQGRLPAVLARVPARPGDTFHLPAGTLHATGPDLLIFEIQQASDVTYRFYDWDRPGDDGRLRPLHLERALAVLQASGPGRPTLPRAVAPPPAACRLLVTDRHFSLLAWDLAGPAAAGPDRLARVLFVLAGEGRLAGRDGPWRQAAPGGAWLVPAGAGGWQAEPGPEGLVLLESLAVAPPAA
ncbi:MAG: class I mannose-6-phosphate isomerase [Deltaproteobacteria bacterium]|nr:class I mannose-6-phosphate isomerase [Deltaproteobacteria bacterium]